MDYGDTIVYPGIFYSIPASHFNIRSCVYLHYAVFPVNELRIRLHCVGKVYNNPPRVKCPPGTVYQKISTKSYSRHELW